MPRTQMITKTNAPTQCGIEFPYHTVCSDFMADFYYSFDRAQAHQLRTPHRACDHYFCLHLHPSCPFPFFFNFYLLSLRVKPDRTVSQVFCMHTAGKKNTFFFSSFFFPICPFLRKRDEKGKIEEREKTKMRLFYFFSALVRRRAIFP